jgi:hypothetical protein
MKIEKKYIFSQRIDKLFDFKEGEVFRFMIGIKEFSKFFLEWATAPYTADSHWVMWYLNTFGIYLTHRAGSELSEFLLEIRKAFELLKKLNKLK